MKEIRKIQIVITVISFIFILGHLIFPDIKIDSITISLLIIAVIPWLFPLFKSLELPGGLKFEFQELEQIGNKIKNVGLANDNLVNKKNKEYAFIEIANENPQLALVSLRIELEKKLKEIYEIDRGQGIVMSRRTSISWIMRDLFERKIINNDEKNALRDMINVLNKVVHGENLDYKTAQWVKDIGPKVLNAMDKKIDLAKKK
ncbi:MAG: hypothetical protein KAT32_04565 [Candidatus Moranbacteria bacterium]|nr:hypothetical protein [Candidatus Moranbacteria bacterium]